MRISHEIGPVFALSSRLSVKLQERLRHRLRRLVETNNVQLRVLGERLGLSPSGVGRILNEEGYNILLTHVEGFCEFFQITPSELMVEPGSLIQPIKPLEAQLLAHFRAMTELQRHSLLSVLDRSSSQPATRRRARLGRAELTEEQQLLVDLYARSPEQARGGILKTLRGTARLGDEERGQRQKTE